eukprot:2198387-Rhodomonas_salina.2
MKAWCDAGYAEGFSKLVRITRETQNLEHYIGQATRSGTVSLLSREFGRGLDFPSPSKSLHVHVVQTFLSAEKSEEIQIQGRTARQGSKGFYKLVLLADHLSKFGVGLPEIETARASGTMYKMLDVKRRSHFETKSRSRQRLIQSATASHKRSLEFVSALTHSASTDSSSMTFSRLLRLLCELNN